MNMWKKLKRYYLQFKEEKPGERFLNSYKRWRGHGKGYAVTILVIILAAVLIAGGILLGLVPGVPGIVLVVLGLALIATRFRWMATGLDWTEVKMRKIWRKYRRAKAPI